MKKILVILMALFAQQALGQHSTGLVKPRNWREGRTFLAPAEVQLPSKWDWRDIPGGLMPIKNQKNCGSCWAFGSTAVMESAILIKDHVQKNISEQQMLSCNNLGYSCGGGYFDHQLQMNGVNYTADYPYYAKDAACNQNVAKHEKIQDWAFVGGTDQKAPTTEQIKQAIYQYGPVAVTVTADNGMQRYSGWHLFKDSTSQETNHIVTLVGWNDTDVLDGETGYWIMRNSWGAKWGSNGYMAIKYGAARIGEEATFVIYKPACADQPKLPVKTIFDVAAGTEVELGVEAQLTTIASWRVMNSWIGSIGSKFVVAPSENTEYRLTQKTTCGTYTTMFSVRVN